MTINALNIFPPAPSQHFPTWPLSTFSHLHPLNIFPPSPSQHFPTCPISTFSHRHPLNIFPLSSLNIFPPSLFQHFLTFIHSTVLTFKLSTFSHLHFLKICPTFTHTDILSVSQLFSLTILWYIFSYSLYLLSIQYHSFIPSYSPLLSS